MIKNQNTTIDKIALSEFDMHYEQLGDNEKQWCHDELVNNKKWLDPEWKQPGYICQVDKWILGIEPWYTCAEPKY
tara:strand:+ start:42 stop:266 length:225 start_codon:yes stop_codon:yes gene_type:complete